MLVLVFFYKKHQNADEKAEAVLEGAGSTTVNHSLSVSESVKELNQTENSADLINENSINEQSDIRKEISD